MEFKLLQNHHMTAKLDVRDLPEGEVAWAGDPRSATMTIFTAGGSMYMTFTMDAHQLEFMALQFRRAAVAIKGGRV